MVNPVYCTANELRLYLPQLGDIEDTTLVTILKRAQSVIDTQLKTLYNLEVLYNGYATSIQSIPVFNLPYLQLPPYQVGTITKVTADQLGNFTIDPINYIERSGSLWLKGSTARWNWFSLDQTWAVYVTANWGNGDPPEILKEAILEIAVRIWRGKDSGFSDVVGTETGQVGYNGKLPGLASYIMDMLARQAKQNRDLVV